ncbi:MAG: YcxB family protein [Oscillibacter sp.]|nr:YcxB family protein [Oscillibacter sp.]
MEKQLIVPSRVDEDTFTRFGLFDTFRVQKRWRPPALFAALFCVFSAVCLASGREGGRFLGGVLLLVGLGLPAAYLINFFLSLKQQAKRLKLDGRRIVYTLRFQPEGVAVNSGQEETSLTWAQIHHVYRAPGCTYLYAAPRKAFLLPHSGQEDAVWQLVEANLPEEKRTILDKK